MAFRSNLRFHDYINKQMLNMHIHVYTILLITLATSINKHIAENENHLKLKS